MESKSIIFDKIKKIAGIYILLFTFLIFQGCADIEEVNKAANTALETLKSFKDINYSFTESYKKYGVPQALYNGVDTGPVVGLPNLNFNENELQQFSKADQTVSLFFLTLTSYFEGMSKLSDKDLVGVDFSKLGEELKADGISSKLNGVTPEQIDASVKIATILANDIMGAYREKNIRRIIVEYDGEVTKTIDAASQCLDILIKNIKTDSISLDSKYTQILANPTIDKTTKLALLAEFQNEISTVQNQKAMLIALRKALSKIKKAHNDLAAKLKNDKLTSEETKKILKQYIGDAKAIYDQITILQKK